MKMVIIDNNIDFAERLRTSLSNLGDRECAVANAAKANTARELSDKVKKILEVDQRAVLLINVNLIYGFEKRPSQKGIELLTWLRLIGVMNHVIMYSFLGAEMIGSLDQKNLILFSTGVTFLRLPLDISILDFEKLDKIRADIPNLKMYLRAAFNIGLFRHRDANWWGLKQLWDVHQIYTEGKFKEPYPSLISNALQDLNNAVAVYLHGLEAVDVVSLVESVKHELGQEEGKEEQKMSLAFDDLESASNEVKGWNDWKTEIEEKIRNSESLVKPYYGNTSSEYKEMQFEIERIIPELEEIRFELARAYATESERRNAYEQILRSLRTIKARIANISPIVKARMFSNIPESTPNDRRIFLIDDMADQGFAEIFKRILRTQEIRSVALKDYSIRSMDRLFDAICKRIDEFDPEVVLLDLRLFDETGASVRPEDLSGRMVLDLIRSQYPALPVIIISGSNKIASRDELMKAGADAYWVKEGLDERRRPEDSAYSHYLIRFLVDRMTGARFKTLRRLSEYASSFASSKSGHWSLSAQWPSGQETRANVDEIARTLQDSVYLMRTHLRWTHLRSDNDGDMDESFVFSALINKLAGLVEIVHAIDVNNRNKTRTMDNRLDAAGVQLFSLRNQFSHSDFRRAKTQALAETVEKVIDYLSNDPANAR